MAQAATTLRRAEAARTAGRRMIARGERPMYRVEVVRTSPDVAFLIVELPWLRGSVASMRDLTDAARTLVGGWLEARPDAFDVEGP